MCHALTSTMTNDLPSYEYDIIFVDNKSQDSSWSIIRKICSEDQHVKAVFNRMKCGPNTNLFHGLRESDGDCVVPIDADFQEPVDQIPVMVREWEKNNKVVYMIKTRSKENKLVYFAREMFYRKWMAWAQRCRIPVFRELRKKIKRHFDAIVKSNRMRE